jgi:hypothetical protein
MQHYFAIQTAKLNPQRNYKLNMFYEFLRCEIGNVTKLQKWSDVKSDVH